MTHERDSKPADKTRRVTPAEPSAAAIPGGLDPRYAPILNLQALVGNQAVQRLVKPAPVTIQHVPTFSTSAPDISREDENVEMARELFERGDRLFHAGNYAAAITQFERARQVPGLDPSIYPILLFDLAIANLRLERFATAVTYFEQYLQQPGVDQAEVAPLLEQARQGTAGDAERIMEREGGELPPPSADPDAQTDSARTLFEQANALYAAGQYRQSIIIFEQVREMEITEGGEEIHTACIYNIGRGNFELGRFSTAIIYLEQYIDRAPSEADRTAAEELLVRAQEEAGALTSGEQAEMMMRLANTAYDAGDYATALARFQTLLGIRAIPEAARSQIEYNVGVCHLRLGNMAEAKGYFERYLAAHPGDPDAQAQLDSITQQLGENVAGPAAEPTPE